MGAPTGFHPLQAAVWAVWTHLPRGPLEESASAPGAGVQDRPGAQEDQDLVSKLLQLHFTDSKTKVGGDALRLMAELLTIFVVEAAIRSVRQAQAEDLALVDVDQLEKVLPQLLLDF
ncbi:centromere protein X [Leptonychotes weddellii]|uniref:Centromere protein X n=1 Tax=Leptonychotes weddellii TaxID=9713 RepID=A0A7F8RN96_LEPWE|nr:centromere protein X [Leptonychotes weddellii]